MNRISALFQASDNNDNNKVIVKAIQSANRNGVYKLNAEKGVLNEHSGTGKSK